MGAQQLAIVPYRTAVHGISSQTPLARMREQRANLIADPYAGVSHAFNKGGVTWLNQAALLIRPPEPSGIADATPFTAWLCLRGFLRRENTKITERIGTQFRIEMFNLFNRTNLAPPSGPMAAALNHCGHHRRLERCSWPWPWRGVQHAAGAEDYLLARRFRRISCYRRCLALAVAFRRSVILLVSEAQP